MLWCNQVYRTVRNSVAESHIVSIWLLYACQTGFSMVSLCNISIITVPTSPMVPRSCNTSGRIPADAADAWCWGWLVQHWPSLRIYTVDLHVLCCLQRCGQACRPCCWSQPPGSVVYQQCPATVRLNKHFFFLAGCSHCVSFEVGLARHDLDCTSICDIPELA